MKKRILGLWVTLVLVAVAGMAWSQEAAPVGEDASDKEIAACYRQIQKNPKSAAPWRELGLAFYKKGDWPKAEDALMQSARITPDAKTNMYLGLVFEKQQQMGKAIDAYAAALNLNPKGKLRSDVRARLDLLMSQKLKEDAVLAVQNEQTIKADTIPENTIAVVNFDGSRLQPELAPIGAGLAEFTSIDLAKVRSLRVVDRLKIDLILDELKLGQSAAADKSTAPRVGKLLGSRRVVTGTLIGAGEDKIRLDGAVITTTDSSLKYPEASEGDVKAFFKLQKQFVFSVLDKMGITLTSEERDAISKVPTESYLAFIAYCRGLDYRNRGDFDQAKAEFNNAAAQDNGFTEAANQSSLMAAAAAPPPAPGGGDFPPFEAAVLEGTGGRGESSPDAGRRLDLGGLDVRLNNILHRGGAIPGFTGSPRVIINPPIEGTGTVVIRGTTDGK
ncbi:MAG: tetratricopeptide repeat protein [Candidatus Zixiibacteriota bacterium]